MIESEKMIPKKNSMAIRMAIQTPFTPKRFFVTSGKAVSSISSLNAFDTALWRAGIAQCNLVGVSSILPAEAEEVDPFPIAPGTITFAVLSRMDGVAGQTICAGIAWGWTINGEEPGYGLVAEGHGYKSEEALRLELRLKLKEMAEVRGVELVDEKFRIEHLKVPEKNMDAY